MRSAPRRRPWLLAVLGAVAVLGALVVPIERVAAQAAQEMEISDSCVAVKQRIPALTVWGSGWDYIVNSGARLTLEWSWGGAPTTPRPATVNPPTQNAGGSFALSFDVTGLSPGFSAFSLVSTGSNGSRTNVGSINLEIKTSCPGAAVVCTADAGGKPVLDASVAGYPTTWSYRFFYQFRRSGQQGPYAGSVGSDGAVHGQLTGLSQVANATITAKIVEPAGPDSSPKNYYLTFAAPICNPPPPTTTSTTTTTSTPGTTQPPTTSPDTVPDAVPATTTSVKSTGTTTTIRPSDPPGPPVTLPPALDLPPVTVGATLTVTPEVGPAGFVTGVTGTGFPPGPVELRWEPGLGRAIAIAGADGTFITRVLVFPNDRLGARALIAVGGPTTAIDAFLVVPSTVKPSGSNVQQINRIRRFNSR